MRLLGVIARLLLTCLCVHGFSRIPLTRDDTNVRVVTIHSSGETEEEREVVILSDRERCDTNEVWYSCLPSYPITCENLYRTGRSKVSGCLKGCDCAKGYVRKYIGSPCIPIEDCSERIHNEEKYVEECPKHEVFISCGSSCAEKCNNDREKVCPVKCEEGCFCRPGYVRLKNGKCVNNEICLRDSIEERQCTSSREIYRKCGRRSDERCHSGPRSRRCESGCFCKNGYVRIGGNCVRRRSACGDNSHEQKCSAHEEWTECGRSCQDDCIDWGCPIDNRGCKAMCRCKAGYKRIRDRCVEVSQCLIGSSRNCTGQNEVHRALGQPCDELCDRGSCNEPAKSGCFCRENFYRINQVCQPATSCSIQQCVKPNEKYKCARRCQEQCSPCEAGSDCEWGCYCDVGFVRDNPELECIAASACLSAGDQVVEEDEGVEPSAL